MATTATSKAHEAADKAAARTLHLTNPLMTGEDVTSAQKLLTKSEYGNFHPGDIDGEYGPATAGATKDAKRMLGYPDERCDGAFGPKLRGFLGGDPLPADYTPRRKERLAAVPK